MFPNCCAGCPIRYIAARLVAAVGLARARFMIFTAAELTAPEAMAAGLVGEVVPHAQLDSRVDWALAQVRSTGPSARAVMKHDINARLPAHDMTLFSQASSAEMMEGMASFVDKRDPVWPRG